MKLCRSGHFRLCRDETLQKWLFSFVWRRNFAKVYVFVYTFFMVIREKYLARLRSLRDQRLIKVVTGIRRSGKSTLLEQFRNELLASGVDQNQITFLNFEELENQNLLDYKELHSHISQKLDPNKKNYIFLDEVQIVDDFEKAVDSLFVKQNVDIYLTGSNAFMLSGELATLLTGRYVSIHVLPYSFAEYKTALEIISPDLLDAGPDRILMRYLESSSFPEAVNLSLSAPDMVNTYLRDLFNTVLHVDIARRHDIRSVPTLERTLQFLMSSIGSPVSATNIAKSFGSVSHATIGKYLDYLARAYLVYEAQRYDIKGKRLLRTQEKYYTVDLGLRNILLSESQGSDRGHKLENVIYLELLRRGGEVRIGKHGDTEVDFLVQSAGGQRYYYQVAFTVSDAETLKRELRPFKAIKDNYPKYLITTDLGNEEHQGIQQINASDWLLSGG